MINQRLRMADGCVLLGRHVRRGDLEHLAHEHFPFVFIGRREAPGTSSPTSPRTTSPRRPSWSRHLVGFGHRRMVYLRQPENTEPTRDRLAGLARAIERYDLDPADITVTALPSSPTSPGAARGWLAAGVTALLVEPSEDHTLVSTLDDLAERSTLSIPGEVSIALLGDPPSWQPSHLDWTRFALPRQEIARQAVGR